jgi:hypothetical protein
VSSATFAFRVQVPDSEKWVAEPITLKGPFFNRKKFYFASPNFHESLIFLLQLQNRSYDFLQFFKTGQLSSLTGFEAEVIMVLIFFGFFICANLEVTKYKKVMIFHKMLNHRAWITLQ